MRVLVLTPTYNEAANIEPVLRQVRAALPDARIAVVDDASPDGTADIAERVGAEIGGVQVIRRTAKDGLGNAYRAAFDIALGTDADVIVQMDADLSHDPATLPLMIAKLEAGYDMVIGSRYVPGGATQNWPWSRRVLSKCGNWYTATALGLPLHDLTAGFRAWRRDALAAVEPGATRADGYAFLTELAMRAHDRGLKVGEVPILFVDRTHGTSKMSHHVIRESMTLVTKWGARRRLARLRQILRRQRSTP